MNKKYYTKAEWDRLFRDILSVYHKCGYGQRQEFADARQKRAFLMNAYREASYFAKEYPVSGLSNDLFAAFVAYAGTADSHQKEYSLDFKLFLMALYQSLAPYFENQTMNDEDWCKFVKKAGQINEEYTYFNGSKYVNPPHNLFFYEILIIIMNIFDDRAKEVQKYV